MIEPFIIRAIIAGVGIAIIAGAIGCFVVWRKMAYFGDSLAHSALLGVALGLVMGISTNLGTIIICSIFAVVLIWLQQKKILATDTLLGILAHSALSVGMVTLSLLEKSIDLHSYLFGDILAVTSAEIYFILFGGFFVLIFLYFNWSSFVLMTIDEKLARAEGINIVFYQLLIMLLMTVVVAVSFKIVGLLLITSLLIIPAAAARQLAKSPEKMAAISSLLAVLSVTIGIYSSLFLDTPSGPSIVVASTIIFVTISIFSFLIKKNN
jgi:zinc transport system permease protein|tara:strand:+ start:49 stop:846 length:798 start_codon:yes stop_codon:yes gene_type:complete